MNNILFDNLFDSTKFEERRSKVYKCTIIFMNEEGKKKIASTCLLEIISRNLCADKWKERKAGVTSSSIPSALLTRAAQQVASPRRIFHRVATWAARIAFDIATKRGLSLSRMPRMETSGSFVYHK